MNKKIEATMMDIQYMGWAGCYITKTKTICLGSEQIFKNLQVADKDDIIKYITNIIIHEEDHRIIHALCNSMTSLCFDLLFYPPFYWIENREFFIIGKNLKKIEKK